MKPAPDFPVDIYFLVDGSFSMEDDLANIRTLGGAIGMAEKFVTIHYIFGREVFRTM